MWALCAPELLFIPDANRDDVPDGKPVVVLDGWDASAVRHNIVNGLKWGPDGWLYGRHGILATSLVGKPGASASQRVPINCGIWRYHPTREVFEAVAHGTTNAWGFDYDDHGEMFFINTVIGHLWHVVPGAHYRRMYGTDFNPHLYQLIEQTADHFHWDTGETWSDIRKGVSPTTDKAGGGHAHSGLMIYLGGNWPDRYRNTVFTVNLHGRRLNNDRLERFEAGYVGKHEPDLLQSDDPWFRGIDLIYGPDGGVYIADWTDVGECHENDGVHRTSGRIYQGDLRQAASRRLRIRHGQRHRCRSGARPGASQRLDRPPGAADPAGAGRRRPRPGRRPDDAVRDCSTDEYTRPAEAARPVVPECDRRDGRSAAAGTARGRRRAPPRLGRAAACRS